MTFESQTTDKAGQDQLDAVAAEFDLWRRQKTKRAEKVPLSLLREAQNSLSTIRPPTFAAD